MSQYIEGLAKVAALPPPNVAPTLANGGAGNVDVGTHEVAITFVQASGGETLTGADAAIVISGSAAVVNLTGIPLGPVDCTKRFVYASKVGDPTGPKFRVGEISNNTATTFAYNVQDANLGQQEPATNRYPTAVVELTNGGITGAWVGKSFKFQNEPVWYQIASVQSDVLFTLSTAYTGLRALGTGFAYVVSVDFTTRLGLAELSAGDVDIRDVFTRTVRLLDGYLAGHKLFAGYTEFIQSIAPDKRALSIKAAAGQSAGTTNIFEVLDENGVVVFAVEADGTTTQTLSTAVFDQVKSQTLIGGAQRNIAKYTDSAGNAMLDVGDTGGWFATRIFAGIGGAAIYAGNTTPVATPYPVVAIGLGSNPSPSGLDTLYVKNATAGGLSSGRAMTIETDENSTTSLSVLRVSRLTNTVGHTGGIAWVMQDDQPARVEYAYTAASIRSATSAGSATAGDWLVGLLDAGVSRRIRARVANAGLGLGFGTGNQAPTAPTHAIHIKGALDATTRIRFESGANSASFGSSTSGANKLAMFDAAGVERITFDVAAGGQSLAATGLTVTGSGHGVATIGTTDTTALSGDPAFLDRHDGTVGHRVGLSFRMLNSTPVLKEVAYIGGELASGTAGAELGNLYLGVTIAGTRTPVVTVNSNGRLTVNNPVDVAATAAAMSVKAWSAAAHGIRVVNFTANDRMIELGSAGSDVGVVSVYDGATPTVEQSRLAGGAASWILGRLGVGPSSGNLTPKTFSSSSFYAGSTGVAADLEADSTSGTTFGVVNVTRYDATAGHQAGISLRLLDGGSAKQEYAYLAARIRTNTAGAEEGDVVLSATRAGARTELARLMGSTGALALGTGGDASAMVHVLKSQNADTFVRVDNAFNTASATARVGLQGQMWDGAATNPAFTIARNADGLLAIVNHSTIAGATDSRGLELEQAGNYPIRLRTNASQGQALEVRTLPEEITIAAAATTDSSILIPANAVVLAVTSRVTTVIPTAATFKVGYAADDDAFGTGISTAATTTWPGTDSGPRYFAAATAIRITPNLTPGAATGKVRIAIHYYLAIPATS